MDKLGPRCANVLFCVAVVLLSIVLGSCGGGSSSTGTTAITKITVTPASGTVSVGQSQTFFAAAVDVNNNVLSGTFAWASSATNVATVDANGVVTGVAAGTSQITASAQGVTSNTATITVATKVASVKLTPLSPPSIAVNGTTQFTATALDSAGNPVAGVAISWSSSFAGVATIDSNGLVTGVKPGTVTIIASAGNIFSQPATLTVTP